MTNEEVLSVVKELPLYVALTLKRFNFNKKKITKQQVDGLNAEKSPDEEEEEDEDDLINLANIKVIQLCKSKGYQKLKNT